jgi:hypothetical protein
MSKYFVAFIGSLALLLPRYAETQQIPLTSLNRMEAQKVAAEREAASNNNPNDPYNRLQRAQIANAVAERRAQLQSDTEKLVALTIELKAHVDKTGVNILSMDVIKKAQEIQKLAKSVQERMKNPY